MRRLEERVERHAQRLRVDLRARQEAAEAVMRATRDEVEGVRRDMGQTIETMRQALETMRQALETTRRDLDQGLQRLEGGVDRQGSHLADWLIEVEARLDELHAGRLEDLREMQAILGDHLAQSAGTQSDYEQRLRRLEGQGPAA